MSRFVSLNAAKGNSLIVVNEGLGVSIKQLQKQTGSHPLLKHAEALTIWRTSWKKRPVVVINGFDDKGIMYGLLDVADRISWTKGKENVFGNIVEVTEQPTIAERAVSVYTMNRSYWESRFYDEKYWVRYFDLLARSRFNMFTIIFGYENGGFLAPPYPYFFDVDSYPRVKMNGLTKQEQQHNLSALNAYYSAGT